MEPWPQGKTERHDGIAYELVHRLDVPVPQIGEQLPNVVQFFAAQLPVVTEPVIEVPKILPLDVPLRRLCRDTQLAEQLVEVPTVLSLSSLQQLIAEHIVDIPVPGRAGRGGGVEVVKVSSQDRIQLRLTSSKPLTFQFRAVEIFKALAQDRVQQLLHLTLVLQMKLGKGFFRTFPRGKKCGDRSALGVGTECGL